MRAHEVCRYALRFAVAEERGNPRVVGRSGTADADPVIDVLQRIRRSLVQREIVGAASAPERLQIRLVPHLEKPLAHLADAVALLPVLGQRADERGPLRVVLRRRDIATVVKHRRRTRGERGRHEAQLDERPHSDREQKIPDAIRIHEGMEPRFSSHMSVPMSSHSSP